MLACFGPQVAIEGFLQGRLRNIPYEYMVPSFPSVLVLGLGFKFYGFGVLRCRVEGLGP